MAKAPYRACWSSHWEARRRRILADVSRALVESLRENPNFRVITNGEVSLDAVPDELLPYRFLLSPTLDTQTT